MRKLMVLVTALGLVGAATPATVAAPPERSFLVVGASTSGLPEKLEAGVLGAGGRLTGAYEQIGVAVAASSDPNFQKRASRISGVASVVPNSSISYRVPVNPVAGEEVGNPPTSGDDDSLFDLQWGHDAIDAPEAWAAGYRGDGALVAVLDDGVDSDHPDLASNLREDLSTSFVPEETYEYDAGDAFSHGSHTSGTIVAADNGQGTIGVAPDAEFFMVKVLSSTTGSGSFEGVAAGIVYAAEQDADIINMSLGGVVSRRGYLDDGGTQEQDDDVWVTAREVAEQWKVVSRATTFARGAGTTIIASAGNDSNDGDKDKDLLHVPSDAPGVISVSATGPSGWGVDADTDLDGHAFYTNYGRSAIDFSAPGGNVDFALLEAGSNCTVAGVTRPCYVFDLVYSTGSDGAYYWSAGTSMAAPHVTGVAALAVGKAGGNLAPAQVEAALRAGAEDLGQPRRDPLHGLGRVNAYKSVTR